MESFAPPLSARAIKMESRPGQCGHLLCDRHQAVLSFLSHVMLGPYGIRPLDKI
jgi:hypothetical protein